MPRQKPFVHSILITHAAHSHDQTTNKNICQSVLFGNYRYKIYRASREDMAAAASAAEAGQVPRNEQHSTLMEDPDVWRPT